MADHTVRILDPAEHRDAVTLFGATLHHSRADTERWERAEDAVQPGRVFGAFDNELIGTARSADTDLVVPGGASVPNASVTAVGVRSDRTRRGVLSSLMRAQLADFAARGVVTANLHASEGGIYERFGYGPATHSRQLRVERHRAVFRRDLPASGEVDRISLPEAEQQLPDVYAALPAGRAGMLRRTPSHWRAIWTMLSRSDSPVVPVVHRSADGVDGFATYEVQRHGKYSELTVHDMHTATTAAFVGLWRYLCGVDLVDDIVFADRALDEPGGLLFADPRCCRDTGAADETWLRIVDVRAALDALPRDTEPLVIEVSDPLLPANSARYRVAPDAVTVTDLPPELAMDVATLGMIYLGAWLPSTLAAFGRITNHAGVAALGTADRLFHTARQPWCGSHF